MEIFKRRETPVQNIAYIAIMAAINIVFVLLSNVLPVLLFLLVFILPLTSTVVTIYCKKRYFPIYFVVTLALCLAVSSGFNIFDTFIYVLPSLITGFIFGISLEKNIPSIITFVSATIVQYLLTILTFFILGKIVTNLDLTEAIIRAFGLGEYEFKRNFIEIFLYIVSAIQIFISYIFMGYQAKYLGLKVNLECQPRFILYLYTFITGGLAIFSYFYFSVYTLVILLISLPIYLYELVTLIIKKKIYLWIVLGVAHLLFMFVFALLYKYTTPPNGFIIFYILFGIITIIDLFDNYCFKQNRNNIK